MGMSACGLHLSQSLRTVDNHFAIEAQELAHTQLANSGHVREGITEADACQRSRIWHPLELDAALYVTRITGVAAAEQVSVPAGRAGLAMVWAWCYPGESPMWAGPHGRLTGAPPQSRRENVLHGRWKGPNRHQAPKLAGQSRRLPRQVRPRQAAPCPIEVVASACRQPLPGDPTAGSSQTANGRPRTATPCPCVRDLLSGYPGRYQKLYRGCSQSRARWLFALDIALPEPSAWPACCRRHHGRTGK